MTGGDGKMAQRLKSWLMLAGFCSLAAMFVGQFEARAGTSSGAITITGGYKPGHGDPPYDYIFDVYLNAPAISTPGTNTFASGNYFSIEALPGVNTSSTHNEPFSPPGVTWSGGAVNTVLTPSPPASAPYESDFTWLFTGSTVYSATTPSGGPVGPTIFLGQFTLETTFSFPNGVVPLPSGTILSYTYTYNGTTLGSGTFPIISLSSVPEPSSAILLAAGIGVLPMFWQRERRRRQGRQAIA
jgi:hypothetical protein